MAKQFAWFSCALIVTVALLNAQGATAQTPPGQGGTPPGLAGGTPPGKGGNPPGLAGGTPPGLEGKFVNGKVVRPMRPDQKLGNVKLVVAPGDVAIDPKKRGRGARGYEDHLKGHGIKLPRLLRKDMLEGR